MTPEQVHEEVKASELQGRGGRRLPDRHQVGLPPANVFPRYVVVNGDESEPGTYKDRMLMELDPHQLIEGIVLTCYAVHAAQAFLYVRGEMALAQERLAAGAQRRLRPRHGRAGTSSTAGSASTSRSRGAPAPTSWARRRRSSRASRASAGCPG